jgi:hypothetical protein
LNFGLNFGLGSRAADRARSGYVRFGAAAGQPNPLGLPAD